MGIAVKLTFWGFVALIAMMALNWGQDLAFQVNAIVLLLVAAAGFVLTMRERPLFVGLDEADGSGYMDDVVRAGCIATALWGVVGFLAGTYIAFQLVFPALNWDLPYTSFGRLRPLHTSAVIFAFVFNALFAT